VDYLRRIGTFGNPNGILEKTKAVVSKSSLMLEFMLIRNARMVR